ncbi:polyamine ABC transporter substrate-binding protein [Pelagibius sp.]|uniref:polyamine ABC transporter substrate-binding protein n=1 Tax=Pelagibius sp. TaxID=1931238 RepID=UPI003B503FB7
MKSFLTTASTAALAVALGLGAGGIGTFGPGAGAAMAAEKIVISNWDGYMPKDLPEKFKAETGIEVEVALHATNEEIMGKVVAGKGKGYDVLFVSSPFAEVLNKLGLSAPIDHAKVPNFANLYPEAASLEYDPGNSFSAPYAWGTTGLCYRSDLVEGTPSSWNDLLNPSDGLKGKVTMLATDRWLMAAGMLARGYSVNETSQAKIDEVKAQLIETKKDLLAYDDTTFYSKLVSGEASLVHAWDGWCNYGIAENDKIRYVIPEEGTDLWVDTMVITAASENKDAAHKFINYILSADNGKWVAENILYKVPNKAAMEALDSGLLASFPNLDMAPADMMKQEQLRDLGSAQKAYTKAVTEITASN